MKSAFKIFAVLTVLVLAFATIGPRQAGAYAYESTFTTSITYQNVGTGDASIDIYFYEHANSTAAIHVVRPTLVMGASTSINIGNVHELDASTPFEGSAVMVSNQPLLATLVQISSDSTHVLVRPLSNGFSSGSDTVLVGTILKNSSGSNSKLSIQNADSEENIVHFKFVPGTAGSSLEFDQNIKAGASYYVDAAATAGLGTSFSGSAVITAHRLDGTTPGSIVGSVMELDYGTGVGAKAFEGVPPSEAGYTVYMPSALCDYSGSQRTAYAVQNIDTSATAHVLVTYRPGGATATADILPGAKASFRGCDVNSAGFIGSAVITSTGAKIIAIGKASGSGLSTAFLGQISGYSKLALPYVRWAPNAYYQTTVNGRQRTSIAIQNVGSDPIPAGSITVTYTDSFGHTGSQVYGNILDVGAKFSSNPSLATPSLTWFGMAEPPAGGYGGGAIITCTAPSCQLIAIGRVASYLTATTNAAEDYNAMPVP